MSQFDPRFSKTEKDAIALAYGNPLHEIRDDQDVVTYDALIETHHQALLDEYEEIVCHCSEDRCHHEVII